MAVYYLVLPGSLARALRQRRQGSTGAVGPDGGGRESATAGGPDPQAPPGSSTGSASRRVAVAAVVSVAFASLLAALASPVTAGGHDPQAPRGSSTASASRRVALAAVVSVAFASLLAALASPVTAAAQPSPASGARQTARVVHYLDRFTPGTPHEAIPHGLPTSFMWHSHSTVVRPTPPNRAMSYINIRGAVYADASNVHPANTRVQLAKCSTWGLQGGHWRRLLRAPGSALDGRAWAENFSAPGPRTLSPAVRTHGRFTVRPVSGFNYHYYNNTSKVPLKQVGSHVRELVTGCSARLVLADPAGPDHRSDARYVFDTGNDWKTSTGGCTKNTYGSTLCWTLGNGRFVRVTKHWRRAVWTTLTAEDLRRLPPPPVASVRNPDGSVR